MNKLWSVIALIGLCTCTALAQSLDELNVQLHGYATQGFVYTTQNNWNSMKTSDGSPAWTEAVFNMTAQPQPKLRVGAQLRYYLIGSEFGNALMLDWAVADYKLNEKLGLRFGKVKTPGGLYNDVQDIDPAFLWSLLPQSVYPVTSRNPMLAHYGAVAYGNLQLPSCAGKLEYQIYFGQRVYPSDDGFFIPIKEAGAYYTNGLTGPTYGGTLRWHLPVEGLMAGVALEHENQTGDIEIPAQGYKGKLIDSPFNIPFFFARYEHKRFMIASEYSRAYLDHKSVFSVGPAGVHHSMLDRRQFYAMSSYKLMEKLMAGIYYASIFDKKHALGPDRYHKDWAISARYDFNPYVYLKVEEHITDGTNFGYLETNNTTILPDTRMTVLKLGVTF